MTPFLDWTLSPFAAAYFAYHWHFRSMIQTLPRLGSSSEPLPAIQHDVLVWSLLATPLRALVDLLADEEMAKRVRFHMNLVDFTRRQQAQQSIFTESLDPEFNCLEDSLSAGGRGTWLTRYELPGNHMIEALWDLSLMNINSATLFPDLDGATRWFDEGQILKNLARDLLEDKP